MMKFKTIGLAMTMSLIGLSDNALSREVNTLSPVRGERPIINRPVMKRDLKPDLRRWVKKPEVKGAALRVLKGRKAGLSLKSMPVRTISKAKFNKSQMKSFKSGLYVIGLDYIPHFVKGSLKRFGYKMARNGEITNSKGEKLTIFVGGETGLVKSKRFSARGLMDNHWDIENRMLDLNLNEDNASPYQFRCYSFHPWAVYYGGFHRWYDVRTHASTYTTDPQGGCSVRSPRTNIEYLQTYALIKGAADIDNCNNCNERNSRDVWDVGRFWPAHGRPASTYHHAVYRDGGTYFSRTSRLGW